MQIKPQTIYLEENATMNAEFPEKGQFHLFSIHGSRYKVCGDPEEQGGRILIQTCHLCLPPVYSVLQGVNSNMPGPSSRGWSIPRPWIMGAQGGQSSFSSSVNPFKGKKTSMPKLLAVL